MSSLSVISLLTGFLTAMVVISEFPSSSSSNGDDPPKKPQQSQKKPQEEEDKSKQIITQQENHLSFFSPIPQELIEACLSLIPRRDYPTISLVSRYFRRLIASSSLYQHRSLLNITDSVLYAFVGFPPFDYPRWFILHRNRNQSNSLQLRIIDTLQHFPFGSALVTIGQKMYVLGGCDGYRERTNGVFLMDCRTHRRRELRHMRGARYRAAVGVIDGKIYVIGGREKRYPDWVEVLDLKTGIWSSLIGPFPLGAREGEFETYVVMQQKIYLLDYSSCLSYEPRTRNWESCGMLREFWQRSSCVVDDMLYTIDPQFRLGSLVIVYDPREMNWRSVNVVGDLPHLFYYDSKMANFGGKLVILGTSQGRYTPGIKDICCVVIALEKRENGEIRGNVELVECVLTALSSPSIELCRTITF
ncbi:unnamed protein product [Arabis nemorensis]|uniref:F-box domain-containing protein n=1 Tax=Arabis nemorensis TaxID=586526 RepID=A0A565C4H4_9BRAS|nr:unnamed protein product [Arabis nemorensis]